MLVGNKLDLRHQRSIPSAEGIKLAKEENSTFIETSAKDATNVQKAFRRLLEQASENLMKKHLDCDVTGSLEQGSNALNDTKPNEVTHMTVVQKQPKKEPHTFRKVAHACLHETKEACSRIPCCFY